MDVFNLTGANGAIVKVAAYGATIVSVLMPDRRGQLDDVVLGYDTLADYKAGTSYFGATIGRYGNRIARGLFQLYGKSYPLAINNPPNHLHGGLRGFDKRLWEIAQPAPYTDGRGDSALRLSYFSKDGEEGYPGDLGVSVTFSLSKHNELRLYYRATTDRDTVLNLTNHSYFNLAGAGHGDILDHELMLAADTMTPVDSTLIPTGELRDVAATPFDFRTPRKIGERIAQDDEQLRYGKGYDHNFVLRGESGVLRLAAEVYEAKSGRTMSVRTTQPGVQFYSGNVLDGKPLGRRGQAYGPRAAFCLETQHFPDSPNRPQFPRVVLKAGELYEHTTIYQFGTR